MREQLMMELLMDSTTVAARSGCRALVARCRPEAKDTKDRVSSKEQVYSGPSVGEGRNLSATRQRLS